MNEPDYSVLEQEFSAIHALKDPSKEEFELSRLAHKYQIVNDVIELIYRFYKQRIERERSPLFLGVLGSIVQRCNRKLETMEIIPFAEKAAKLGVIIAAILFIYEFPGRLADKEVSRKSTQYEAWRVLSATSPKSSSLQQRGQNHDPKISRLPSAGRKEAISFLAHEGLDLTGIDLSYSVLEGLDLRLDSWNGKFPVAFNWRSDSIPIRANLDPSRAILNSANFEGSSLIRSRFDNASLIHANFQGADLFEASFNGAILSRTQFRDADLRDATFVNADLRCTDFRGARFLEADQLINASKSYAETGDTLRYALIDSPIRQRIDQHYAKPPKAYLSLTTLVSTNNLRPSGDIMTIQKQRGTNNFACHDMSAVVFKPGSRLAGINLAYYHLDKLRLEGIDLSHAVLTDAYINNTSFKGSNLRGADLRLVKYRTHEQILQACNWRDAKFYSDPKEDKAFKEKLAKLEIDSERHPPDCTNWQH